MSDTRVKGATERNTRLCLPGLGRVEEQHAPQLDHEHLRVLVEHERELAPDLLRVRAPREALAHEVDQRGLGLAQVLLDFLRDPRAQLGPHDVVALDRRPVHVRREERVLVRRDGLGDRAVALLVVRGRRGRAGRRARGRRVVAVVHRDELARLVLRDRREARRGRRDLGRRPRRREAPAEAPPGRLEGEAAREPRGHARGRGHGLRGRLGARALHGRGPVGLGLALLGRLEALLDALLQPHGLLDLGLELAPPLVLELLVPLRLGRAELLHLLGDHLLSRRGRGGGGLGGAASQFLQQSRVHGRPQVRGRGELLELLELLLVRRRARRGRDGGRRRADGGARGARRALLPSHQLVDDGLLLLAHLDQDLLVLERKVVQQLHRLERALRGREGAEPKGLGRARLRVHGALPLQDGAALREERLDARVVHLERELADKDVHGRGRLLGRDGRGRGRRGRRPARLGERRRGVVRGGRVALGAQVGDHILGGHS
mmetsp:Transcript_4820/g.14304  ORF Transcript_4820/g.14304 Transcript_4820/m.14304 type:complete len:491 (+) Transcript_4820:105-1577(+)